MRESKFIDQNREKWETFEQVLEEKEKDPDQLNDLFVQVTDDLSFSRTFYPNRLVRAYLNGLAQRVYISIYKTKRSRRSRLLEFWKEELPFLIWESRREFRLSFLIFLLSLAIGVFSTAMDPDFAQAVLGEGYVSMTEGNIEAGDPMAVYKGEAPFGMAIGIIGNNLFVAFLTFIAGALFAIGTVGVLIRNGVMVGVFQFFFIERGLFWDSFLTIWMHGALEISAIVIAGAAGLILGRGLVFPGTLSRMKAFQISARRGLKIMLSLVPLFVVAGTIEGYLTRHTELPNLFRGLFILSCFAFILYYYVWYPMKKAREGFKVQDVDPMLSPDAESEIDLHKIQSGGELFSSTFTFFRNQFDQIAWRAALAALIFCALVFPFAGKGPASLFVFTWEFLGMLKSIPSLIRHPDVPWLPFLQILIFTGLSIQFFQMIRTSEPGRKPLLVWLKVGIGAAILVMLLLPKVWYTVLSFSMIFPLALVWVCIMQWEGKNAFLSVGRLIELVAGQIWRYLGFALLLTGVGFLLFLALDSMILWLVFDSLGVGLSLEQSTMDNLITVVLVFCTLFLLYILFAATIFGASLLYFTLVEIRDAPQLRDRIEKVHLQARIQGLPREE
ncbi:MAG: stage II sporulation protein M [Lewinellaceae bacterium]|nr:stage II sporulation protein M [Lewinellaceae bacterium]